MSASLGPMAKVYPSSYYGPADQAAECMQWELKREWLKRERKRYRQLVGCAGCWYAEEVIKGAYLCQKGNTPHKGGFCGDWFDIRTGKRPDEI